MPRRAPTHRPGATFAGAATFRPPERDRQAARWLATNDPRWLALRDFVLDREPLCRECAKRGRRTAATDVDHIDGHASEEDDYRLENLQPLCKRCHSRKTARENGGFGRGQAPPRAGAPGGPAAAPAALRSLVGRTDRRSIHIPPGGRAMRVAKLNEKPFCSGYSACSGWGVGESSGHRRLIRQPSCFYAAAKLDRGGV